VFIFVSVVFVCCYSSILLVPRGWRGLARGLDCGGAQYELSGIYKVSAAGLEFTVRC